MAEEQGTAGQGDQVTQEQATEQVQAQEQAPAQGQTQEQAEAKAGGPGGLMEAQGAEEKPAGAPDSYDPFNVGEGAVIGPDDLEQFTAVAKKSNLTQAQAQEFIDSVTPSVQRHLQENLARQAKQWEEAARADPEYGGENFNANLATAKKAYEEYATPELKKVLVASGLGNHPEMIRLFVKLGKTLEPDQGVNGGAGPRRGGDTWYPNSPQMRK